MRSALFCDITQRSVVVLYWRFGRTYIFNYLKIFNEYGLTVYLSRHFLAPKTVKSTSWCYQTIVVVTNFIPSCWTPFSHNIPTLFSLELHLAVCRQQHGRLRLVTSPHDRICTSNYLIPNKGVKHHAPTNRPWWISTLPLRLLKYSGNEAIKRYHPSLQFDWRAQLFLRTFSVTESGFNSKTTSLLRPTNGAFAATQTCKNQREAAVASNMDT
jgi:hypothetical protein